MCLLSESNVYCKEGGKTKRWKRNICAISETSWKSQGCLELWLDAKRRKNGVRITELQCGLNPSICCRAGTLETAEICERFVKRYAKMHKETQVRNWNCYHYSIRLEYLKSNNRILTAWAKVNLQHSGCRRILSSIYPWNLEIWELTPPSSNELHWRMTLSIRSLKPDVLTGVVSMLEDRIKFNRILKNWRNTEGKLGCNSITNQVLHSSGYFSCIQL